MFADRFQGRVDTPCRESIVPRQLEARLEPELGFAGRVLNMHMGPRLLPREEVKPVSTDPENRRTHWSQNIRLPGVAASDPILRVMRRLARNAR